jgi:peptide deformylase
MARVLQHEIDHLNGILICDHGLAMTGSRLQDFQSQN